MDDIIRVISIHPESRLGKINCYCLS